MGENPIKKTLKKSVIIVDELKFIIYISLHSVSNEIVLSRQNTSRLFNQINVLQPPYAVDMWR